MSEGVQIADIPPHYASDFIDGQKDCAEGICHKEGMSDAYTKGYSYEYYSEQARTHRSMSNGS